MVEISDVPDEVNDELAKVNKVWDNLISNIHGSENIVRVRILLSQVMIEYYLDRILILHRVDTKEIIRKMPYHMILDKIIEIKLIGKEEKKDYLRFYDIRNIYAHEIEIHDNQILDIISDAYCIFNLSKIPEPERLEKFRAVILSQSQRIFIEALIRKAKDEI